MLGPLDYIDGPREVPGQHPALPPAVLLQLGEQSLQLSLVLPHWELRMVFSLQSRLAERNDASENNPIVSPERCNVEKKWMWGTPRRV